ncbi:hypothetical protein Xcaj_22920 [Xanthomonas axonopodis pv. cajani]|uniref:Uncharacterized protein n=1 Tax=Xanthomonas axonopodis pv. cajani TaxID=487827 RepID=A0ABX3MET6_9XANT|nr:hypothetical protein Xcaj_22920 [Xanthomonas axonopodis pv. cajani]
MSLHRLAPRLGLAVGLLCACAVHAAEPAPAHRLLRVTLGGATDQATSGRLLVFAQANGQAQARGKTMQGHADPWKRMGGVGLVALCGL